MNLKTMNKDFQITHIKNNCCLACSKKDLRTILDLGEQPLANNYHKKEKQDLFPLKLNLCLNCYHLQLSHTINPDLMFKNYLYVSGTSKTLKDYFEMFANKTLEYNKNATCVLDIACNDGTQLDFYKKLGLNTFGIDPAINLFETSKSKGHNVICSYFNSDSLVNFKDKKFDIILAQNVFAHTKYIDEFLNCCLKLMNDTSVLFVQTSQANMVINNEFDTIYHEHLSFFNTNSMKTIVENSGLFLSDVFKTDIHGTSYVFVITKKNLGFNTVEKMIENEKNYGLYDVKTYAEYALKCYNIISNLKEELNKFKNLGYTLIGYGAAAKGNTLLNFGKINLDFIIDDNPLKQNLYTPGMDIPIVGSNELNKLDFNKKIVYIPLAWNFYNEIKEKIKIVRNNPNDLFIKYFPNIKVES
jgi:2-polyprenyl-3-methyl-5-hydroxy-6-metoxy-1,4-benzoquinol methylase